LETLGLRRPQPARPRLDPLLHQDEDRDCALALRHQGRRRVRDPDDEITHFPDDNVMRGLYPRIHPLPEKACCERRLLAKTMACRVIRAFTPVFDGLCPAMTRSKARWPNISSIASPNPATPIALR